MQSFIEWVLANSEWLSFPAMGIFGGTIGHVLAFETSHVKWSGGQHCAMVFIAWLKALFIATCIFQFQQLVQWNLPVMFLATGVLSIFGSQTIMVFYEMVMRRLKGMTERTGNAP